MEPHFQTLPNDFGTTIAGFFSDGPAYNYSVRYLISMLLWEKKNAPTLVKGTGGSHPFPAGNTCGDLVQLWCDTSARYDAAFATGIWMRSPT